MEIHNQAKREQDAKHILNELEQKLKLKATTQHNKTSGHLNIKKIISQISRNHKVLDTRLFSKDRITEREHDILILLDLSGSMSKTLYDTENNYVTRLKESVSSIYSLGVVLSGLNLNYSIYTFGTSQDGNKTLMLRVKPFNKKTTKEQLKQLLLKIDIIHRAKYTDTATAINTAREILLKEGKPENKKLMVILSDGFPCKHFSTSEQIQSRAETGKEQRNFLINATNQAIEQATKENIKTLAISLSNENNEYLSDTKFTQKVYLNEETIKSGNFNKTLINAYLKAVSGGIN